MKRAGIKKSISFLSANILIVGFILFVQSDAILAQSSLGIIDGVVINQDTNESIPTANVYLSNTTLGAPSNPDGSFRITKIPAGNYDLIIQFVGFEPRRIPISIDEGEHITLGRIKLRERAFELEELEVTSSRPRQWRRELRRFEKAFIGSSFNASKTTLENPEVLSFTRDEKTGRLYAEASGDLHVINKSLGYELFNSLIKFSWDTEVGIGSFMYTSRFVELEPKEQHQAKIWHQNREATYEGSFQHFLFDLQHGFVDSKFEVLNGTINEVVRKPDESILLNSTEGTAYTAYRIIPEGSEDRLLVRYDDLVVSELYGRDNNLIVLDNRGIIINPENIIMAGYWFDYRIADLLPLNYQ